MNQFETQLHVLQRIACALERIADRLDSWNDSASDSLSTSEVSKT